MTCPHPEVVEVVLLDGTSTGRALCASCLGEVPAGLGCPDCEWQELRSPGAVGPLSVVRSAACPAHAGSIGP